MNRRQLNNEKDMLQGNINRMCVTDSKDELMHMYAWANIRINEIFRENRDRIMEQKKLELLQREVIE
jgi:hypothetical protein